MSTSNPAIKDVTLQKLVDGLLSCVRLQESGAALAAAPNAWKTRSSQKVVLPTSGEVTVTLRTNFEGTGAVITITPHDSMASSVSGVVDTVTLSTLLV